jgi:hypothetical protein
MWAKHILIIGICIALTMSALMTIPYVFAWSSFNAESREMNVVALKGTTYSDYLPTTMANISLVAAYPKAAVYAQGKVFTLQLVFLVDLDSQITLFRGEVTDISFLELGSKNPSLIGTLPLAYSPLGVYSSGLVRHGESGHISPFFVNYSATVSVNVWPPAFAPNRLYFTGSYKVHLEIALNAVVSTISNSSVNTIGFGFIMEDYPVTIYCFNYPLTLWAAYGSSIVITASVSMNYHFSRKRLKKS